jgi:hypothetical protein
LVTVFKDQDSGLNGIGLGDWLWSLVAFGGVSRATIFDWGNVGTFAGTSTIEDGGTSLMIGFVVGVGIVLRRAFWSASDGIGNRDRVVERCIRGIVVIALAMMLTCAARMSRADGARSAIAKIGSIAARTYGSHAGRSTVNGASRKAGRSHGSGSPVYLSGAAHGKKRERH